MRYGVGLVGALSHCSPVVEAWLAELGEEADYDESDVQEAADEGFNFSDLFDAVRIAATQEIKVHPDVLDFWQEAVEERDAFSMSAATLGDAVWIYGAGRDRGVSPLPTLAPKLELAIGYAALALAVADLP